MREWTIKTYVGHKGGTLDIVESVNLEELREYIKDAKKNGEIDSSMNKTSFLITYAVDSAALDNKQSIEKIEIKETFNAKGLHQ